MSLCVSWEGPCEVYGKVHGCKLDGSHRGWHKCKCGAIYRALLNGDPKPRPERAPRFYQRLAPRTRPYTRRDPTHYYPKYLKRKRGIT